MRQTDPRGCRRANLEGYFQQGLVTENYSALKLTSQEKSFPPPLDNSSSHLQDKKEKKMTKKGGQKRQLKSRCVLLKGPFIFYFRESVENAKIPIMALVNVANLPTSQHTRITEFTLKEQKRGFHESFVSGAVITN